MPDEEKSADLREAQARREQDERKLAEHATEPEERLAHERRSEEAAYLTEKLEEQRQNADR
jgi:hypothetical protein